MIIKDLKISQDPYRNALIQAVLNVPPSELSKAAMEIKAGKKYTLEIKPYREPKSKDQLGAIWGKIGELADALYASKEEIYEECLRRYGPIVAMRTKKEALGEIESKFRIVDIVQSREDGTVYLKAYKGLSEMDTAQASKFLDGILSECKEVGISAEVKCD